LLPEAFKGGAVLGNKDICECCEAGQKAFASVYRIIASLLTFAFKLVRVFSIFLVRWMERRIDDRQESHGSDQSHLMLMLLA